MDKALPYLRCLKCNKKIYANEIRYKENNTISVCPYCNARNIVRFRKGNGEILFTEFRRLDKNEK